MRKLEKQMEVSLEKNNPSYEEDSKKAEELVKELWMSEPHQGNYETIFNGKAGYDKIIKKFQEMRIHLTDENIRGIYLMALVDTLENISEEIFEYYRDLQILLKKDVLQILELENIKKTTKIAYVIMKGVRLGHLSEDYLKIGIDIFENLLHQKPDDVISFMKAYEEYLYLQK